MTNLFTTILNMSITASYVALAIIFVRLLLKKAPKIFSYALWGVLLLRLICPFSFESGLSLLLPKKVITSQGITNSHSHQIINAVDGLKNTVNNVANSDIPTVKAVTNNNSMEIIMKIAGAVWLFGIIVLLIYGFVSYFKLRYKLSTATIVNGNIFETDRIKTPFVLGVIKPKIYLPTFLEREELNYIIKHEQTHIKRLDYLIKPFAFLAIILHWFNPLMWICYFLMVKDLEMSSDESVMKKNNSDIRTCYSNSLLSLSIKQSGLLIPLAFGENNAKKRIKNVLNYKKPAIWVILVGIIVVASVWIGFMLNPRSADNKLINYKGSYTTQNSVNTSSENNTIPTNSNQIAKDVIVKELVFSANDSNKIKNLTVNWIMGNVKVLKTNSKEIKIVEKGYKQPDNDKKFSHKISFEKLEINDNNSIDFSNRVDENQRKNNELDLEIFLPEKEYKSFSYNSVNAEYAISNLAINKISGETTNGSLILRGMKVVDLIATSVNGCFNINDTIVEKIFNLNATNAEVIVDYKKVPDNLNVKVVNGEILLTIPENDGFKLKKDNGGFVIMNSDFSLQTVGDDYVYKNGQKRFNLSCVNGLISISRSKIVL